MLNVPSASPFIPVIANKDIALSDPTQKTQRDIKLLEINWRQVYKKRLWCSMFSKWPSIYNDHSRNYKILIICLYIISVRTDFSRSCHHHLWKCWRTKSYSVRNLPTTYDLPTCTQLATYFLEHLTLWTYGLTKSSNLYRMRSITFTRRCLSWSSKVGDMSSGSIWLNSGPAPNSRALSVIWRRAALRIGGVPFFIFSRSFIILRSFCSSGLKLSSSTSTYKQKYGTAPHQNNGLIFYNRSNDKWS